jgi:hypothetical protein
MSADKPSQPTDRTSGHLESSDDTLNALLNNIPTDHEPDEATDALGHLRPARSGPQEARPGPQEATPASRELLSIILQRAIDLMDVDLNERPPQEEGPGQ